MKRLIYLTVVLIFIVGCSAKQPPDRMEPLPAPTPTVVPQEVLPTPEPAPTATPEEVGSKILAMTPVLDSLALALTDTEMIYSVTPDFFWNVLYLMSVNHGNLPAGGETTVEVPSQKLMEYAAAAFENNSVLLPLPKGSTITYDKDKDTYIMELSDRGDNQSEITGFVKTADQSYSVTLSLKNGEGVEYAAYEFILGNNPTALVAKNPVYYYSVSAANKREGTLAAVRKVYEREGKNFVDLDIVAVRSHLADDLNEQGRPYGNDFLEVVNENTDVYTLEVTQDTEIIMGNLFEVRGGEEQETANKPATMEIFLQQATKQYMDEPQYFYIKNAGDTLTRAELWWMYYFSG